jgi:hypothetical protein
VVKPHKVRTIAKRFLGGLLLAMIFENYVILNIVNYYLVRQEALFLDYIRSLGPPPPNFSPVGNLLRPAYPCELRRYAKIYTYKLCVYDAGSSANEPERLMLLVVIKPAAYLTLVPWNYPDRMIFDGERIFTFVDDHILEKYIEDWARCRI